MVKEQFDPDAIGILLDVKLSGPKETKKIKMLLDTGASLCIIPFEIANILGYKPYITTESVNITTASGVESMPTITLESISVLGLKAENVITVCHDLPETSRVDGLLGLSYLKNFKLTLDFKNGILELE